MEFLSQFFAEFIKSEIFQYVVLPVVIVLARITDVSMATLRIILITKGLKKIAPLVAFCEVFIWVIVARQILSEHPNFVQLLAYCVGYTLGTYIGILIDNKLSLGKVIVRIITGKDCMELQQAIWDNKFGLTTVDAHGKDGELKLLFIVINRIDMDNLLGLIKKHNPHAFFTIENVQSANAGFFAKGGDEMSLSRFGKALVPWKTER